MSSTVTRPTTRRKTSEKNALKRAWWWKDSVAISEEMRAVVHSETELLNASVLCAALSVTQSEPTDSDQEAIDRIARKLKIYLLRSPLPHTLQPPTLKITFDYVLVHSDVAMFCAVRATKPADILLAVVGSAASISHSSMHRFGGARIHVPFWNRVQRLDLQDVYHQAQQAKKMLLLCGHSIGGSIAQLGYCELVYQRLPRKTRLRLEKRDNELLKQREKNNLAGGGVSFELMLDEDERAEILRRAPHMLAIGFGSPYAGSTGLNLFLKSLQLDRHVITFVNEFDCIPSILNTAQSAALIAKTTERLLAIAKATKALLHLLPIQMQQRFVGLADTGTAVTASSAYLSMSLGILQKSFDRFRDFCILKEIGYDYSPCGTYIILSKSSAEYKIYVDSSAISKTLHDENAGSSLTGNAILQHMMSAYVNAIARRSISIQINASMDFYERLGVPRNATERQIRSAYKRLALKWHPDRWATNIATLEEQATAEEVFKLLAESYEVLSDLKTRKTYDAHLNNSPGLREEFMRDGTVNGMTIDEAIITFRDVINNFVGAASKLTKGFSNPSSIVVRPLRTSPSVRGGFIPNNHDNMFLPDRIRVSRTVGIGADQREQILYLKQEEVVAGDSAAPAVGSYGSNFGLKTVSVVGGAVAVGASVALIAHAWSQYSENAKKKRQAAEVRNLPSDCLILLLEDRRNTQYANTAQLLEQIDDETKRKKYLCEASTASSLRINDNSAKQSCMRKTPQPIVTKNQWSDAKEDKLIEEFFDCASEYEIIDLEAMAEEEFFDCLDLMNEVSVQFCNGSFEEEKSTVKETIAHTAKLPIRNQIDFPPGSIVNTPFGLATVQDWRGCESYAIVHFVCCKFMVGYIKKNHIVRGVSKAKIEMNENLESKRAKLAECVVARYSLEADEAASTVRGLVAASRDGALDSGIRAAGGVALASGMLRSSPGLGGAVAAPLTIASIIVDIGKEYFQYRKQHACRKSLGGLSSTTEQLMMREFRLKVGEVIACRTAAAAGVGIGAYSAASILGMCSTAGLAGPVGIVAATSAAFVGGMLGYFAGSKAYSASTVAYFNSQQNAKEHIDHLELGARILFNEFDSGATGTISTEDCITLIEHLYNALSSVSRTRFEKTKAVIKSDTFKGPVTWNMFWEWVSFEAAQTLCALELIEESKRSSKSLAGDYWWKPSYFSKEATPLLAEPHAVMYPSVLAVLGMVSTDFSAPESNHALSQANKPEEDTLVLNAQIECLANNGHLTGEDAFQLQEHLASDNHLLNESARKTVVAINESLAHYGQQQNFVCDGFGNTNGDMTELPAIETDLKPFASRTKNADSEEVTDVKKKLLSNCDRQFDVMCSLLSQEGLQNFLQQQDILGADLDYARHEDSQCLALAAAPKI
ncbi:uncharacterized protein CCR75_000497 [Bremia lactucae]|uniref:J domain-containing protein n=1 Tax=Bremia lactucae TaxID=4779 RepID=A0A976FPJ5_BRELC|nr:hypothetical protein CCR75_000497 [Bremia lactucae]